MKTFQITVSCHNAEGLREALENLIEDISLSRESIDAVESGDDLPIGDSGVIARRC